jgi:hypothetical protein
LSFDALGRLLAVDKCRKSTKNVGLDLKKIIRMDPNWKILADIHLE